MANILANSIFSHQGGGKMIPADNITQYQVASLYESETSTKGLSYGEPGGEIWISVCKMQGNALHGSDIVDISNLNVETLIYVPYNSALDCNIYDKGSFEVTKNGRIRFTPKQMIHPWETGEANRVMLFCK